MRLERILLSLISVLCGILLSVISLEAIFRFLPVSDSLMMLPVNSTNPYTRFRENRDVTLSRGYNFSIVTKKHVNNYGFLSDQDYTPEDDSPLSAVIGDSYVEAVQVENAASMHGILSEKAKAYGRVYSFGASGSPLSNYLAYAHYAISEFSANSLVFVIVGNDFDESLTKYKSSPGMHYFSDVSGRFELVRKDYHPTLMKRLLRTSALARYVSLNLQLSWQSIENVFRRKGDEAEPKFVGNTQADFSAERISDSIGVVDSFLEKLPVQTGLVTDNILFVIDGIRPNLYAPAALKKAEGSYFDLMRKYFIAAARSQGYEVIDMQPIFIKEHESEWTRFEFPTDGHWNEIGHALVAREICESVVYRSLFAKQAGV